MKHLAAMFNLSLVLLLTGFISGCASKPVQVKPLQDKPEQVESKVVIKGAPDWVNNGSSALTKQDARIFHGVGSASPMGDMALQKAVADDRARAEVARVLSSYLEVVATDFVAAAKIGGDTSINEEIISSQIRSTSKANMTGARIIGSWRESKTNTIWSIAELDMKYVKSTMAAVSDLNTDLKIFFDTSADNIFDRFTKRIK